MIPSIEAAKKLAKILDTSVGYLLGENEQSDLFKDPKMLQRFQDISVLPEKEKECLLITLDHFIKASKIRTLKGLLKYKYNDNNNEYPKLK